MRQLWRRSLQWRVALIVMAGATLFAAAAAVLAYALGHGRAVAQGRASLEDLAAVVENSAAIGAFASDPLLLEEITGGLARNALVARVEVVAADGKSLARHTPRPVADGALTIERRLFSPADRNESIGRLRIVADMDALGRSARTQGWTLALAMVAQIAVIALLTVLTASRLISRPIVALARELRAMAPGTDRRLASPVGHAEDELGTLTAGANALLEANSTALQRERELRAEVEAMEAQYRQIFDSTSAGIFVLDAQGRLINSNPTVSKVLGCSVEAMRSLHAGAFIQQVFAQPERVLAMVKDSAQRRETVSADLELRSADARLRWVHCLISVQGSAQDPGELVEGVMYDITERKRNEQAVAHRAEHDALTGLKNRAASEATIDRFLTDTGAGTAPIALLYIDLDGFKQVNDTHGHQAGDEVLRECARRLRAAVRRSSDLVGRLGGDEFIVCLYNTQIDDAAIGRMANQIVQSLRDDIALPGGATVRVGASIGIACSPRHGCTRAQLEQAADAAMYRVKREGKNAYAMAPCSADA